MTALPALAGLPPAAMPPPGALPTAAEALLPLFTLAPQAGAPAATESAPLDAPESDTPAPEMSGLVVDWLIAVAVPVPANAAEPVPLPATETAPITIETKALAPDAASPPDAAPPLPLPLPTAPVAAAQAAAPVVPLTPSAPAMPPLSLDDPHWSASLGERVNWATESGLSEATIDLNPEELGPIRIRIETQGQLAEVSFQAAHAATRELLSQSLPQLRELLNGQGLEMARSQVASLTQPRRGMPADDAPAPKAQRRLWRLALVDEYA